MSISNKLSFLFLTLPYFGWCQKSDIQFIKEHPDLKINQIQVLGTHNSYAQPIDSNVLNLMDGIMAKYATSFYAKMTPEAKAKMEEFHPNGFSFKNALKYEHPDFGTQLNAGVRSLEIDVYYDPTGNRFNHPSSYKLLREKGITSLAPFDSLGLSRPGFKVLHMADVDFRSHYTTFKNALESLKQWSDGHPGHIPIFIMVEAKDESMKMLPNSAEILPFGEKEFDALDKEVLSVLGRAKLITPDDVIGNYATLKEAVLHKNWPLLDKAQGKFVFLLEPSTAGLNITNSPYVKSHPNLKGRLMFIQSEPESDYGAFLLMDNAIMRQKEIKKFVEVGYMVRSRSDIETYEAEKNDYTRAHAAFSSGAQVVSTDFSPADRNPYGNSYKIELPDKAISVRKNPVD